MCQKSNEWCGVYPCYFFDLRASISRGSYGDLYWMAGLASETRMNGQRANKP